MAGLGRHAQSQPAINRTLPASHDISQHLTTSHKGLLLQRRTEHSSRMGSDMVKVKPGLAIRGGFASSAARASLALFASRTGG